jgi:hypothetical protein
MGRSQRGAPEIFSGAPNFLRVEIFSTALEVIHNEVRLTPAAPMAECKALSQGLRIGILKESDCEKSARGLRPANEACAAKATRRK